MKRWEAAWNHAALAAVSLSGLVYGALKYFVPPSDPDARIHPWQPAFLKAHVIAAPLAIFGLGLLWRRHALGKWRRGESSGRRTGAVLLWLAAPLAATGYLIPVLSGGDIARPAGWCHAALGVLFVAGYALHPKRRATPENGAETAAGGADADARSDLRGL